MAKKLVLRSSIVVAVIVVLVLVYPLHSGKSLQDATADEVAEQVPGALDILAQRYPVKVGLARTALNNNGFADKVAQEYVRSEMKERDMGLLDSYVMYYSVVFDKDDVRKAMADQIEKELGLA